AVCNTQNIEMVRSLGADHVVDYTSEDFTTSSSRYDFILDNVGNHSMAETRRALKPTGSLLSNGGGHSNGRWIASMGNTMRAAAASMMVRQQGRPSIKFQNRADL